MKFFLFHEIWFDYVFVGNAYNRMYNRLQKLSLRSIESVQNQRRTLGFLNIPWSKLSSHWTKQLFHPLQRGQLDGRLLPAFRLSERTIVWRWRLRKVDGKCTICRYEQLDGRRFVKLTVTPSSCIVQNLGCTFLLSLYALHHKWI